MRDLDLIDLWPVTSCSRPCQARLAVQRLFFVCTATVSSAAILKRHDDHWSHLMPIVAVQVQFGAVACIQGHFRPYKITRVFFCLYLLTEKKKERWRRWSHCVQLVKTHRLIYRLTFLGRHLTLRSRDHLKFKFDFDLTGQEIHVSMSLTRETRQLSSYCSNGRRSKVIQLYNQ